MLADGDVTHLEGEKGVAPVRKVCTNGDVEHYDGDSWEERLRTAQAMEMSLTRGR